MKQKQLVVLILLSDWPEKYWRLSEKQLWIVRPHQLTLVMGSRAPPGNRTQASPCNGAAVIPNAVLEISRGLEVGNFRVSRISIPVPIHTWPHAVNGRVKWFVFFFEVRTGEETWPSAGQAVKHSHVKAVISKLYDMLIQLLF